MVLTYFLNGFEMVPVAPIITGITIVFTLNIIIVIIIINYASTDLAFVCDRTLTS
jgi:hypothetical protein